MKIGFELHNISSSNIGDHFNFQIITFGFAIVYFNYNSFAGLTITLFGLCFYIMPENAEDLFKDKPEEYKDKNKKKGENQ